MSDLAWMRPKLAELCGLYRLGDEHVYRGSQLLEVTTETWRPDEDVAQAVRCLEALGQQFDMVRESVGWMVRCFRPDNSPVVVTTFLPKTLPQTICLAIAAALGWEKP